MAGPKSAYTSQSIIEFHLTTFDSTRKFGTGQSTIRALREEYTLLVDVYLNIFPQYVSSAFLTAFIIIDCSYSQPVSTSVSPQSKSTNTDASLRTMHLCSIKMRSGSCLPPSSSHSSSACFTCFSLSEVRTLRFTVIF